MDSIIKKNVVVYLKNESDDSAITGILMGLENKHVYIQVENNMFIIPQENIKYYQTLVEEKQSVQQEVQAPKDTAIKVFINGEFFTVIPVPPTTDLSTANERVLKIIWGNPDVQSILRGRIQKALEYVPGEVNITLVEDQTPVPENQTNSQVSFSMGAGGSPLTSYLNPSDMVGRLNSLMKKGEPQNERKT